MTDAAELLVGPDRQGLWVRLGGGVIEASGAGSPPPAPAMARLDCAGCEILPGRVNAHTHLYSGLAPLGMPAPLPPPENFVQILERVWWRLDRALDAASLRAAARLYVAEALLHGTTALVDHHESPTLIEGSLEVLADACAELGIRAILTFGATERNGGPEEGRRGLAECRAFVERNRHPLLRGLVGLHASFTVSDATVRTAGELARELAVPLHVHVAEDRADVEDARRRGWAGPLERLEGLGALPAGSLLAHGVHLTEAQVRRAEELGAWIVQNPRSNRGNRVGYPRHLVASGRVALGTDGYPADMGAESEALRLEAAAHGELGDRWTRRAPAGRALLAEVFGVPFELRRAGAADLVVAGEAGVRHVVVGGRLVVQEGRLLTADLESVRAEAATEAAPLWRRMGEL